MALLMYVLWAACVGSLDSHVHLLPSFHDAREPLVAREMFRPVYDRTPLPQELGALLLPAAGRVPQPRGVSPAPGPVEVWCGRRQVGVRVDRMRLRHWSIPGLFRLSSCGVSAATARYLYFHRGLDECGRTVQVVGGQLVYIYTLTYTAPRHGFVVRVPPLNMILSCHYNRFYYSYRVGFQPQAPPSTFLKSVRSQTSFSLSVCNSQWEVLSPEHNFLLGESMYFIAQSGALRPGERLYVDSCFVTSSKHPDGSPIVDIIANFGCMVDSVREDSNSHFDSRGPSWLRFTMDSLLFSSEGQMLFLHCSMSVGLQPSPSSKSCTFNKAVSRWLELEASPSVCSCCEAVCEDLDGADSIMVRSAAWQMAKSPDQLHQGTVSLKRGPDLTELHQGDRSLKRGPDLTEELHQGTVSLKRGPGLTEELHEDDVSLTRDTGLTEELQQGAVSLKRGVQGLTEEQYQNDVSLKNGGVQGLEEHQEAASLKWAGQGLTNELVEADHWVNRQRHNPENDSTTEYTVTQSQHSNPLFQRALTNHTAAQNQSVTTAAGNDKGLIR